MPAMGANNKTGSRSKFIPFFSVIFYARTQGNAAIRPPQPA